MNMKGIYSYSNLLHFCRTSLVISQSFSNFLFPKELKLFQCFLVCHIFMISKYSQTFTVSPPGYPHLS